MSCTRILLQLGMPVLLAVSVGAPPAQAQTDDAPWTSVGSAGTVAESDLLIVQLGKPVPGAVSMRPVPHGTVHVRYNVVAVAGAVHTQGLSLFARYLDRGPLERVVLRLKEYNVTTGLTTTLLTLDSDSFAADTVFQGQSVATDGCNPPFAMLDFIDNAYFVDVELSRFLLKVPPSPEPPSAAAFALAESATLGPALGLIKIEHAPCIN